MPEARPDPRRNESVSWALSLELDRRDDRRARQVALGVAIVLHGALLLVRLTGDDVVLLPAPDAVIFPTHNVKIKKPDKTPPPEPILEIPEPAAMKVPVPVELAPPEPMLPADLPQVPIEISLPLVPILAIPESPPAAPAPASDIPVRFTNDMVRPVRVAGVEPAYTEAARRSRTQGVVVLDAVIDEKGRVVQLKVLREVGFGLTQSAVRAVSGWRFKPAEWNGRPIAVRYNLSVRFSLQ